jgi:hypothetical protein
MRKIPLSCTLLQFQRHWEEAKSFSRPAPAGGAAGGEVLKNPLDSLWGTVICGVLLTAILYFVVKSILT